MKKSTLALLIIVSGAALPARADTLRCGNVLIQEGAASAYVREKCGEPASKETVTEPIYARRPNGTTYEVGTTSRDIWRYDRGSRQFPVVMTFEGGVLKKLEFEK